MTIPNGGRTFPTSKEFLHNLSQCSPDLKFMVDYIRTCTDALKLGKHFKENPFQLDKDGKRRFNFTCDGEDGVNLLDVFSTLEEVESYIAGKFFNITETQTGESLSLGECRYDGPVVSFYPDANVVMNPNLRRFMWALDNHPAIKMDLVTITNLETRKGGLMRLFGRNIPPEVARGQQSLERRCTSLTDSSQKKEITLLYDIIVKVFEAEKETLFDLSDKHRTESPRLIAERYVLGRDMAGYDADMYARMCEKMIEKHRQGNDLNSLADRIIAATCFGTNIVNHEDKSIVISEDRDLVSVFDIFYNEVLPRYMAKTVIDAMREKNPLYLEMPGYEAKTIKAAKEHMKWALGQSGKNSLAVGILYSPSDNQFHVKSVSGAFRHYFYGVESYRHGKAEMISHMGLAGVSAEKAIEQLMRRDN